MSWCLSCRTICFCCSTEGYWFQPISLPVASPFYLIAFGGKYCQKVHGARDTLEYIHYDTEYGTFTTANDYWGAHPHGVSKTHSGHTIYYCYYEREWLVFCDFVGETTFRVSSPLNRVQCTETPQGAVTLWNLVSNLQRNIEKCFCCSYRGGVLHRATQSEQLATICTEKALRYSLLTRRSRWSVGFTKKSTHARGKLRCKLLEGCYTVQRQLQIATIVAKSRTVFYFVQRCAQQNKMRCKLSRYPVTPRNLQRNTVALQVAVKIAQCNRAFSSLYSCLPVSPETGEEVSCMRVT